MRLVDAHIPFPRANDAPAVLPQRNTQRRRAASSMPAGHVVQPSRPGKAAGRVASALDAPAAFNAAEAFAALTATHIDGGRAAVIRPESRRGLMRAAAAAGLRPFDATLIIAMVQDRARRGEPLADSARDPRLTAVKLPTRTFPIATVASAAVTLALAASIFALAITWLAGV